ncbi:MAG: hypothetical protein ABI193_08695 [Minicystis sp.]
MRRPGRLSSTLVAVIAAGLAFVACAGNDDARRAIATVSVPADETA